MNPARGLKRHLKNLQKGADHLRLRLRTINKSVLGQQLLDCKEGLRQLDKEIAEHQHVLQRHFNFARLLKRFTAYILKFKPKMMSSQERRRTRKHLENFEKDFERYPQENARLNQGISVNDVWERQSGNEHQQTSKYCTAAERAISDIALEDVLILQQKSAANEKRVAIVSDIERLNQLHERFCQALQKALLVKEEKIRVCEKRLPKEEEDRKVMMGIVVSETVTSSFRKKRRRKIQNENEDDKIPGEVKKFLEIHPKVRGPK